MCISHRALDLTETVSSGDLLSSGHLRLKSAKEIHDTTTMTTISSALASASASQSSSPMGIRRRDSAPLLVQPSALSLTDAMEVLAAMTGPPQTAKRAQSSATVSCRSQAADDVSAGEGYLHSSAPATAERLKLLLEQVGEPGRFPAAAQAPAAAVQMQPEAAPAAAPSPPLTEAASARRPPTPSASELPPASTNRRPLPARCVSDGDIVNGSSSSSGPSSRSEVGCRPLGPPSPPNAGPVATAGAKGKEATKKTLVVSQRAGRCCYIVAVVLYYFVLSKYK